MSKPESFPEQSQERQPGREKEMHPEPEIIRKDYKGSGKLQDKVILITGGDSGIGRSAAVHLAKEGAHIAIVYLNENKDARETREMIEKENRECLIIPGDITDPEFCKALVEKTVAQYKKLDVLINNAAVQFPRNSLEDIKDDELKQTFETNILAMIKITRAALPHLKEGARIINTTSITAYRGSSHLLDYSSTKGAIVSFTRSLAKNLAEKKILVNGIAPGPIWTPLIPSTFDKVSDFGKKTALGRAGQPSETGPAFVFLASADSSYITGQVIHINGGDFVTS